METNSRPSGDKVSVRISSNLMLVNTSTGEYTPVAEVRGRYTFPGGFAFMGNVLMMKLRIADLPKDGYRLALLLGEKATRQGAVYGEFGRLAQELGIDSSRLSKLLKRLDREMIIRRMGTKTILINPTFHFRGTAREQQEAIKVWNEARAIGRKLEVVA